MARRRKKKRNKLKLQPSQTQQNSVVDKRHWDHHNGIIRSQQQENRVTTTKGLYARSGKSCKGLSADELILISYNPLFDSAINQISEGICSLKWHINPPKQATESQKDYCQIINQSFLQPNCDRNESYNLFIKAIVRNLLIFNVAPVEQQMGNEEQPFWLWDVSPKRIERNPLWTPQEAGVVPKFFCINQTQKGEKFKQPIMAENMFLIQSRASSENILPPSPVEVAYETIKAWLGLAEYQNRVVDKGVKDYLIAIEGINSEQIKVFREYWHTEVEGSGQMPILGGKIAVHKMGAKSDDEMFGAYKDHLARIVALCFCLAVQDLNIPETSGQNRATAEIHDSQTFLRAVLPMADNIFNSFNTQTLSRYCPGYSIVISDREPGSRKNKKDDIRNDFQAGIITLNEARQKNDYPPVENGDMFLIGTELFDLNLAQLPTLEQ